MNSLILICSIGYVCILILLFIYFFKKNHKDKLIELTANERELIGICKLHKHYDERYKESTSPLETFKIYYERHYGLDPEEYPNEFRNCMFNRLFELYMKIRDNDWSNNMDLKQIISASFEQTIIRDYEEPIDRVLADLYAKIQGNIVLNKDKSKRYDLQIPKNY